MSETAKKKKHPEFLEVTVPVTTFTKTKHSTSPPPPTGPSSAGAPPHLRVVGQLAGAIVDVLDVDGAVLDALQTDHARPVPLGRAARRGLHQHQLAGQQLVRRVQLRLPPGARQIGQRLRRTRSSGVAGWLVGCGLSTICSGLSASRNSRCFQRLGSGNELGYDEGREKWAQGDGWRAGRRRGEGEMSAGCQFPSRRAVLAGPFTCLHCLSALGEVVCAKHSPGEQAALGTYVSYSNSPGQGKE